MVAPRGVVSPVRSDSGSWKLFSYSFHRIDFIVIIIIDVMNGFEALH